MNNQATRHMVFMPYPARGHINPMLNLCHILSSRTTHTLFTFVVTEEFVGFISSDKKPPNTQFLTIPNVIPTENIRGTDFHAFLTAVQTNMADPFEKLLDRLHPPVDIIVADTFLLWAVHVGNRRTIPVASFWPTSASFFSIFYHFDVFAQNNHYPVQLSERGDECVDYIPGLSPMLVADLPSSFFVEGQRNLHLLVEAPLLVHKAKYLLLSSIYELEEKAINALKEKIPIPIYTFGPSIPYFKLKPNRFNITTTNDNTLDYIKWLDSKSPNTVLYVFLGSFLSVSNAQMDEISVGLKVSGVTYLWAVQGEIERLNKGCGDGGLVVPWCDQLRVLCHSSIGGFWSHCGWNSIMESVFAGVPLITFPIGVDQVPTRKYIVEDWKNGWNGKGKGVDRLVRREEIVELIRRFMDLESSERKEMLTRVNIMKEVSRHAVEKGGSSHTNIDAFIRDVLTGDY